MTEKIPHSSPDTCKNNPDKTSIVRSLKQLEAETKSSVDLTQLSQDILTNNIDRIERRNQYFVQLKFKKSNISLNPLTHLKNAATATKEDVRVSREDYEKYQTSIGSVLSQNYDKITMITKRELASYKVIVAWVDKTSETIAYDKHGKSYPITHFDEMLSSLQKQGIPVMKEENGDNEIYHFSCSEATEKEKKKYILTLEIKNSNISLSLFKHVRNALNKHHIDVEVPKDVYDSVEKWQTYDETGINMASFAVKWHISNIKMKVVDKNIN